MSRLDLESYLEQQKAIVDAEIMKVIPRESRLRNLYGAQWEFIEQGGKRWRPALCILVNRALGGGQGDVLPYAAAIELVHNFSLIHDDIEDGDRSRRGKPTVWITHGIPKAINIGDNLLNKAYESAARLEGEGVPADRVLWCMRLLCGSTITLSEGQAMEMDFLDRWDVTEDEYMDMVWRKTGILVSAAVAGGAYLAGASETVIERMMEYGKLIGPAFQIVDDVLNVSGDYSRYLKEIGGDIKEGKKTLMVIHLLENARPDEAERVRAILGTSRRRTSEGDCRYVLSLMDKYGSVEYARRAAESRVSGAMRKLEALPPCEEREMLRALTKFLVRRDY